MSEVANRLGVSLQRAYQLAREGLLPAVRLGRTVRVDDAKLQAWIDAGGQPLPTDRGETTVGRSA